MRIMALMTYDVFRLSFVWALESMGHHVYHLNTATIKFIEEAIAGFRPDMVFHDGLGRRA